MQGIKRHNNNNKKERLGQMMNLEIQTKPLYLCNVQHSRQGIKRHNKERLGQMMNLEVQTKPLYLYKFQHYIFGGA